MLHPHPTLSEKLTRALTAQRTTALQAVLIERTDVALATLAYGLVSSLWSERYWRANAVGVRTTDMRHTVTQADASIENLARVAADRGRKRSLEGPPAGRTRCAVAGAAGDAARRNCCRCWPSALL
ncbi:hypothetical protein [Ralstonia insidiosa]|uniref:hypothetical protein n=1 Tax=Ralstonia insidiosa TaxID=190721 RepID=UPI003D647268